mmetsp:Transcript_23073/g.48645  ORF Transcript_23073/g.48645 Transcript_23073/m.48645 type:complete len:110 (-) Transcript_23073:537-866(-)
MSMNAVVSSAAVMWQQVQTGQEDQQVQHGVLSHTQWMKKSAENYPFKKRMNFVFPKEEEEDFVQCMSLRGNALQEMAAALIWNMFGQGRLKEQEQFNRNPFLTTMLQTR